MLQSASSRQRLERLKRRHLTSHSTASLPETSDIITRVEGREGGDRGIEGGRGEREKEGRREGEEWKEGGREGERGGEGRRKNDNRKKQELCLLPPAVVINH